LYSCTSAERSAFANPTIVLPIRTVVRSSNKRPLLLHRTQFRMKESIMYLNPERAQTTTTMKPSQTTYTPTSGKLDRFNESFTSSISPRSAARRTLSQANASWDAPDNSCGLKRAQRGSSSEGHAQPKHPRNLLLKNDKEIFDLLGLLRTTEFAGHIDPEHHSMYMKEPKMVISTSSSGWKCEPRLPSMYKSDGHLLNIKTNMTSRVA
jgi:hypothetical protein